MLRLLLRAGLRSWQYEGARPLAAGLVIAWFLSLGGCSTGQEYQLGQRIEMGPFVFSVEKTREEVQSSGSGGRMKIIYVLIRLENYKEHFNPTFDVAFNDFASGSMIAHPKMALVDADGNRFVGLLTPLSGGSMRSSRWEAKFDLWGSSKDLGRFFSESAFETAARHLDKHASDFRLTIDNPLWQRGQPRRAWVQL